MLAPSGLFVLLALPAPASAGALAELGLSEQAARVAHSLSLEERIRKATTLNLAELPPYVTEAVQQAKPKYQKMDGFALRQDVSAKESSIGSQVENQGKAACQEGVLQAGATHRKYAAIARSELGAIHAAQLSLVRTILDALGAEKGKPDSILDQIEQDRALLLQLRRRIGAGHAFDAAEGRLESAMQDAFHKRFDADLKAAKARIEAEATAKRFTVGNPYPPELISFEYEYRTDKPKLESCTYGYRSTHANPNPGNGGPSTLYYQTCISATLDGGPVWGETLAEALTNRFGSLLGGGTERDYVVRVSAACIELAAARLALAEKP